MVKVYIKERINDQTTVCAGGGGGGGSTGNTTYLGSSSKYSAVHLFFNSSRCLEMCSDMVFRKAPEMYATYLQQKPHLA